jgi:ring-1,2-phenylacetyl-CoA epoxidase subunit PaaC
MVRPRPGARRRPGAGQQQPGPDRPGPHALPARRHADQRRRHKLAQRFAHLRGRAAGGRITEDTLAYFRDSRRVPQLHRCWNCRTTARWPAPPPADRDYATTIVRNFLYSALMVLVWDAAGLAPTRNWPAIAAKSLKEVRYHLRHAGDWLVRFGDGTDESHARAQAALDHLLPYCRSSGPAARPNSAAVATAPAWTWRRCKPTGTRW